MELPSWLPPVPSWLPGRGLVSRARLTHQQQVRVRAARLVQEGQRNRTPQQGQKRAQAGAPPTSGGAGSAASLKQGLQLVPGYHWLVSGMPGVGKTRFTTDVVARLQALWGNCPAVYIDSKGGEFDHLASVGAVFWRSQDVPPWPWNGDDPNQARRGPLRLVWTPEYDSVATYDQFLERLLKVATPGGQPVILVVDELSSLGKTTGTSFPVNLARLLKQGRAKNLTLFVLTQELAYIPRQVLRMTTHLAMFMQDPADPNDFDSKRVQALTGLEPVRVKYAFNYRNRMEPEKRWTYRNVQQFLGLGKPSPKLRQKSGGRRYAS